MASTSPSWKAHPLCVVDEVEPSHAKPNVQNLITEMLDIRHPILCGGMGPSVSEATYVAAVLAGRIPFSGICMAMSKMWG